MPRPLTDTPGIGPAAAELLIAAGIRTADALAAASVAEISAVKTFGPIRAAQVKAAAAEIVKSAPKPAGKATPKSKSAPKSSTTKANKKAEKKPKADKKKKKDSQKDRKKAANKNNKKKGKKKDSKKKK